MLVEAVEARFGQANVGSAKLEFLSDNGGAYREGLLQCMPVTECS
jgi:hypothetical protein